MRQSYTVLEEILLSGAPFEEGFSFAAEKPAGLKRKRSLHYTVYRGSRQKPITQDAEFFPYTSSDTLLDKEKKQGYDIYREAAIMSSC